MQIFLKSATFALGIMGLALTHAANAHLRGPLLFNFVLTVEEVSDPQVYVGNDKIAPLSKNTFNIHVRHADYYFKVQYQQDGQSKEAVCPISGAPTLVTATIDPTKNGREACKTKESGRGVGVASL